MRETGVGIYDPLFFIGVVENNVDERLEKRIQVRAFGVHGTVDQVPTEDLPWATLIHGSFDVNSPVPRLNQFVFGLFLDGRDAQQPMILGVIPTQMTEVVNPQVTGWGRIPSQDAEILARGSNPDDLGQPNNSKLERGENIEETYVLKQNLNRIRSIEIADDSGTFEEPAPAYNSEYPFNRVIETAHHSIELDDTPGAERITIFHKSGSYISIDVNGTTVNKSVSDKYEINDSHQHIYVGGKNIVTIMGDSKVLVKGNKTEEIIGDYKQIIHGNHILSVGGQLNLNGSEEVQLRAAKIRIESNVENVNIRAGKDVRIQSGDFVDIKSGATIKIQAADAINLKADGDNINIQAGGEINALSETMYITASGALEVKGTSVKVGGGSKVSINASLVAIDDFVHMAMGEAETPESAGEAAGANAAEAAELPEPAQKGISSTGYVNTNSLGSTGYASQDDGESDSQPQDETRQTSTERLTNADVQQILGGEEPARARAAAEDFLGRRMTDSEWNNLVAATVAESLPNSPQEQAGIMAVILNRVKDSRYPNTVNEVLLQTNQFQAVTGTPNNRSPSRNFINPDERQLASTIRGVNQYIGTMDKGWLNFTSNISAAYGPGTDIGFRDRVRRSSGARVIGGTVFGTV
jgi:spore germination cell wall hydrolase CwlJ-like protein